MVCLIVLSFLLSRCFKEGGEIFGGATQNLKGRPHPLTPLQLARVDVDLNVDLNVDLCLNFT